MHPRQLVTFLSVARHGNITRAAEEVHLAQSSVSDQIQALEHEVGATLFDRTRQGIRLTRAGRALLPYAEEIVALEQEARAAIDQAAEMQAGTLTIGTLETIAATKLASWLPAFSASHPGVAVKVVVGSSGELVRQLEDGKLDVALTIDRGNRDPRFLARKVASEPMVLVGACDHRPVPGDLAMLAREPFIATENGCVYRHLFDSAFIASGHEPPAPKVEAGSIGAITRMVASGMGLAFVPRLAVADALARGQITELAWPGDGAAASLQLLWRRRRATLPAVAAFVEFAGQLPGPVRSADARLRHAEPIPS